MSGGFWGSWFLGAILVVITAEKVPLPLRNLDAVVVKNNDNIDLDIMQQIIKKIKDTGT
jgi:hypothetical protein